MRNQERQEINEYLAEQLFGLKKGADWGQHSKHNFVWYTADELGDEEGAYKCLLCEKLFAKEVDEVCYIKPPPDYTENCQPVLEKLSELCFEIKIETIKSGMTEITAKYHFGTINVVGETLGEAICRAAVEYLKSHEDKQ